jgi:hypothetical protein
LNVTHIDIPDHVIYLYSGADPADYKETVVGWRKASVEIQLYNGIESLVSINTLALVLQTTSMVEFQTNLDVAIGQRLFIGYVPELLNASQFEGRGIYQFEFLYTESYTETLYDICKVELHGSYTGSLVDLRGCDHDVTCPDWVDP